MNTCKIFGLALCLATSLGAMQDASAMARFVSTENMYKRVVLNYVNKQLDGDGLRVVLASSISMGCIALWNELILLKCELSREDQRSIASGTVANMKRNPEWTTDVIINTCNLIQHPTFIYSVFASGKLDIITPEQFARFNPDVIRELSALGRSLFKPDLHVFTPERMAKLSAEQFAAMQWDKRGGEWTVEHIKNISPETMCQLAQEARKKIARAVIEEISARDKETLALTADLIGDTDEELAAEHQKIRKLLTEAGFPADLKSPRKK